MPIFLFFALPFLNFVIYDFGLYRVFACPVARIALVKPEKARGVEDVILRAAQFGQISEKVSEEKLIQLLEQINTQTTKQTKVTVSLIRSSRVVITSAWSLVAEPLLFFLFRLFLRSRGVAAFSRTMIRSMVPVLSTCLYLHEKPACG
nr:DNA-binding protein DDB_G0278111-like [Ipomoea batatas]